jgi:hypothetical protein
VYKVTNAMVHDRVFVHGTETSVLTGSGVHSNEISGAAYSPV